MQRKTLQPLFIMKKIFTLLAFSSFLLTTSSVAMACAPVETVSISGSDENTNVQTPAKYGTGDAELMGDVAKLVKYPKDCLEKEIQGVVVVRFTISAKGKAGGFSILKSLHPSADAEAIRAVKELPNKWKPALDSKGKPVSSNFVLPIAFRLN